MPSSAEIQSDTTLPAVDARLVVPETRYEIVDGGLVHVSPADEAHGTQHSKISALVEAHVAPDFDVATDMLTRTSRTSDIAPDVSVFPRARDPRTGGRQLEQLAFEVVSTETLRHAARKATRLAARGVRRVFAIDVARGRALEWSSARAAWRALGLNAQIKDRALAVPLPIKALVSAAKADDAVARALIAKRNPVIKAIRSQGLAKGRRRGLAEGRRRGLAEGRRRGLVEGRRRGLAEGERQGLAEGRRQGLAKGERRGLAKGERRGLAKGERQGLAEALVAILATRGVVLKRADRVQILGEKDPERLRGWIARAAICTDLAEVLLAPR